MTSLPANILESLKKLAEAEDLKIEEAESLSSYIFQHDEDGLLFATFSAAMHTKGETAEELAGIVKAEQSLSQELDMPVVTDLSSTGGGKVKAAISVNIASSFIVATRGHKVAKSSYHRITSPTGSANIMRHYGIDVDHISAEDLSYAINEVGVCPFYFAPVYPKLKNKARLFEKYFRKSGLRIRTPFHLVPIAFDPRQLQKRTYGCYSEDKLDTLAKMFRLLGLNHTLVFSGEVGMPEVSNIGTTIFIEQKGNMIRKFELSPEEMGATTRDQDEIEFKNEEQSRQDFELVLKGEAEEALIDLVALNAGVCLYIMEDLKSIKEGVLIAKEIISKGAPFEKLQELQEALATRNSK